MDEQDMKDYTNLVDKFECRKHFVGGPPRYLACDICHNKPSERFLDGDLLKRFYVYEDNDMQTGATWFCVNCGPLKDCYADWILRGKPMNKQATAFD